MLIRKMIEKKRDAYRLFEQIRFLLGHASVRTTERYIGSKQKLQDPVNDHFEISISSDTAQKSSAPLVSGALLAIASLIIHYLGW